MIGALDAVVDTFDFGVDLVRAAFRCEPLPPQLLKLNFDRPPTVRAASGMRIETRRTLHSFLRVEQGEDILFEGAPPRDGRVVVTPLTLALMHVHLALESRHPTARHGRVVTETIFEPLPNGPPVEVDVPSKVRLGDSLACAWHSPKAERVRLAMIEDGGVAERVGGPSDQAVFTPTQPGRLMLRITAEGQWGQTTVKRAVEIVAPKVPKLRLTLLRPATQAGHPGEEVRFEWKTEGADSVWLISPGCDAPQRLSDKDGGLLFVRLGWRPADFQLIARGYGGAEKSVVLTAVPQPFACLESN